MKIPMLLKVHIEESNRRPLRLWLPLFLLWPVVLLVAVVALPFLLLALLFVPWRSWKEKWFAVYALGSIFVHLSGLEIDVASPRKGERVSVKII